jgi:hypothetical protein
MRAKRGYALLQLYCGGACEKGVCTVMVVLSVEKRGVQKGATHCHDCTVGGEIRAYNKGLRTVVS